MIALMRQAQRWYRAAQASVIVTFCAFVLPYDIAVACAALFAGIGIACGWIASYWLGRAVQATQRETENPQWLLSDDETTNP